MAIYHGNEGLITLGSETWTEHLVGFTAESSVHEIEATEQGADDSDVDPGLRSWNIMATLFLDSADAPPVAGIIGNVSLAYRDSATDGTISGSVLVTKVSMPYKLNNLVAIDVTMRNKGTMTVAAPA